MDYKVCEMSYFMDKMQPYELSPILDNLNYSVRGDWDIARLIMLSNLQPYSKTRLKPSDIIKFPWDGKTNEKESKSMTEDEVKQAMAKANAMKNYLQQNNII